MSIVLLKYCSTEVLSDYLHKVLAAEIQKYYHANKSYWAVLSVVAVCYAVWGSPTFESVDQILNCDDSNES